MLFKVSSYLYKHRRTTKTINTKQPNYQPPDICRKLFVFQRKKNFSYHNEDSCSSYYSLSFTKSETQTKATPYGWQITRTFFWRFMKNTPFYSQFIQLICINLENDSHFTLSMNINLKLYLNFRGGFFDSFFLLSV